MAVRKIQTKRRCICYTRKASKNEENLRTQAHDVESVRITRLDDGEKLRKREYSRELLSIYGEEYGVQFGTKNKKKKKNQSKRKPIKFSKNQKHIENILETKIFLSFIKSPFRLFIIITKLHKNRYLAVEGSSFHSE